MAGRAVGEDDERGELSILVFIFLFLFLYLFN